MSSSNDGVPVEVHILKGLGVIDGKDAEETLSCSHVLIPHGTVLLLTCSVQDVQQTGLTIDHHLFSVRVLQSNVVATQVRTIAACQALMAMTLSCINKTNLQWNVLWKTCRNLNFYFKIYL